MLAKQAELFFRAYRLVVLPLHEALVEQIAASPDAPLDLATVLEDIGQAYMRFAESLNAELYRQDRLKDETDPEDADEARIESFVGGLVKTAGPLTLRDGLRIELGRAMEAAPFAKDGLKAALVLALPEARMSR